ncbi:HesA/MoeB/ThiF family protein [Anaerospora hongkongensis]|uniref:HesA/MoeB/ThiF family protein n=1 Tax=Anaerospora hongkongensis TaxID=244830 RepID=UPI0028975F8A|nr:ThiF family adenylyltransferase [Anaerospora hongkongensis]
MDNHNIEIETALSIIEKYHEISVVECTELFIIMNIKSAQFCLWLIAEYDHNRHMPIITAIEAQNGAFPHLITRDFEIHGQTHQRVCLYEDESIVKSLFLGSEKIDFVIMQLIRLLNLTPLRQEKEFQQEFLIYWNRAAVPKYKAELFITTSDKYSWLNVYHDHDSDKIKRIVHTDIYLNDIKKRKLNSKIQALYIPIIDCRGILPPKVINGWTVEDVLNVINDKQIAKIPYNTYSEILTYSHSGKSILLVFEMPINNTSVAFCCEIIFKNAGTMKLLKKIETNVEEIRVINTKRCDYEFLNTQIGNERSLIGKKVAIVGVGSLGSYIASEIVRIGIKDIVLFDSDTLEPENLMRHRGRFLWYNCRKASVMEFELKSFHPQVNIISINKLITSENIIQLMPQDIDLVIFTVGSSDVQLECNRQLKQAHFNKPVLFCWLEGNGNIGHVLGIDYSKEGCYQCLFTDTNGSWINNKVNIVPESELEHNFIRNGCGGTRVAYGNASLLQTTYMTLGAIKKVVSGSIETNFLISFNGNGIVEDTDSFYERSCPCCHGD